MFTSGPEDLGMVNMKFFRIRSVAVFSSAFAVALATSGTAWADASGSVGQNFFNLSSGVINEGQSISASAQFNISPANSSGFAGTTTRTFNTNNLGYSAPGSDQGSTSSGNVGGGSATQTFGSGTLTYSQNGVYNVGFNQALGWHWQENASYGTGNPSGNTSSGVADNRTLTVLNVAPTITSANQNGNNANITVNEGSTVALNMTATDPGADNINFTINGGGAGAPGNTPGSTRTSNTVNVTYNNNGVFNNTFQATDQDGANSTNGPITRAVTVLNVAPQNLTLALSSNVINEGQSVNGTMTATDPGADTINFNISASGSNPTQSDSQPAGSIPGAPGSTRTSNTVSLGPFYENNGGTTTANVLGTAFDGDDTSSISDTLTILNVAPIITSLTATEIPNPGPGGCIISFSATAFDPGIFDILVFDWDLDNDGQYDDYTGVPTPNTLYGLGVHTVNVQVSDGDGGFGFASYTFECVPEPTTWVVIALSGGAMVLATRLRRRKSA